MPMGNERISKEVTSEESSLNKSDSKQSNMIKGGYQMINDYSRFNQPRPSVGNTDKRSYGSLKLKDSRLLPIESSKPRLVSELNHTSMPTLMERGPSFPKRLSNASLIRNKFNSEDRKYSQPRI